MAVDLRDPSQLQEVVIFDPAVADRERLGRIFEGKEGMPFDNPSRMEKVTFVAEKALLAKESFGEEKVASFFNEEYNFSHQSSDEVEVIHNAAMRVFPEAQPRPPLAFNPYEVSIFSEDPMTHARALGKDGIFAFHLVKGEHSTEYLQLQMDAYIKTNTAMKSAAMLKCMAARDKEFMVSFLKAQLDVNLAFLKSPAHDPLQALFNLVKYIQAYQCLGQQEEMHASQEYVKALVQTLHEFVGEHENAYHVMVKITQKHQELVQRCEELPKDPANLWAFKSELEELIMNLESAKSFLTAAKGIDVDYPSANVQQMGLENMFTQHSEKVLTNIFAFQLILEEVKRHLGIPKPRVEVPVARNEHKRRKSEDDRPHGGKMPADLKKSKYSASPARKAASPIARGRGRGRGRGGRR